MSDQTTVDGNTAAGMLGEIFPFEMTSVKAICVGCGATDELGAQVAFMDAPGLVLRCVHCESVLIRMVESRNRYWLDLRGVVCLEIPRAEV
jgi:hypothetical protein